MLLCTKVKTKASLSWNSQGLEGIAAWHLITIKYNVLRNKIDMRDELMGIACCIAQIWGTGQRPPFRTGKVLRGA
jgi:hypothetical protein